MFSSLGLFASAPCPEPSCHRPQCFFSHGEPSRRPGQAKSATGKVDKAPKSRANPSPNGASIKRNARSDSRDGTRANGSVPSALRDPSPPSPVPKSVKSSNETQGKGTPAAAVVNSRVSASTSKPPPSAVTKIATERPPHATPQNINPLKPPSIPLDVKISPQPYADRQKGLMTLFQQFTKLYAPILSSAPEIAHTSALAQEAEVSASSNNLRSYKSAIHHAAVSISRRPPPDSADHPSVGTVKQSRAAFEHQDKVRSGKLDRHKLERYLLPLDDFALWAYPDPRDETLTSGGGEEPDAEGTRQTCSRCKNPFVVSSKNLKTRFGECHYHYGRIGPERIEGKRKWIYSCCKRERGEVGCEEGIHVFSDKEDDKALARRVGFKTVEQVIAETDAKPQVKNVPSGGPDSGGYGLRDDLLNTPFSDTTAGSTLARATIVDENGQTLLDELVRHPAPILDANTRFSGLDEKQLESAVMDLEAVRAAACMFIGSETIIIGHGLENDLRALRLVHDKVIDTAIIFPHDKGPPYRRALRDIVKEKLGYFIQDRTADFGHSSAEDAKATLEVLKAKVREDHT